MVEDKHKGTLGEALAKVWLLAEGYDVFENVSPHGLVDLIAMKGKEVLYIDVKSVTPKKSNSHNYTGGTVSKAQKDLGVKLLMVDLGRLECLGFRKPREIPKITKNFNKALRPVKYKLQLFKTCKYCGKTSCRAKFCSKRCGCHFSDKKRPSNLNKLASMFV